MKAVITAGRGVLLPPSATQTQLILFSFTHFKCHGYSNKLKQAASVPTWTVNGNDREGVRLNLPAGKAESDNYSALYWASLENDRDTMGRQALPWSRLSARGYWLLQKDIVRAEVCAEFENKPSSLRLPTSNAFLSQAWYLQLASQWRESAASSFLHCCISVQT